MRVFVVGATGVLGRRIVRQFAERHHQVVALSRRPENDKTIRSLGSEPRTANPFDVPSLVRAAAGADVVVHAATKIPSRVRIRPRDWAENDRIRRDGIRALLEATAAIGARQYIQQSIVWLARPSDEAEFDEGSVHRNPHPAYQSMVDGEASVCAASERHGFRAAILRAGNLYSADAAQTRQMGEGLARRRLPIIGNGLAIWRLVHAEDVARAFVFTAESEKAGLWHVVDDEPVSVSAFLEAMASRLRVRPPRRIPVWLARLVVGREIVSFFTASTRTSSARLKRDLGWTPAFPTFREGLDEIVAAWRAEDFPRM